MKQDIIAKSALNQIGVPFYTHGRLAGERLDCVGLVAYCMNQIGCNIDFPQDYQLRGNHFLRMRRFFQQPPFVAVDDGQFLDGDIIAAQINLRQLHFLIRADEGWVHAHAGLRKVVFTPDPIAWSIIGHWRVQPKGD
jgi:hypothetical protein